jgi:hypothetical protein
VDLVLQKQMTQVLWPWKQATREGFTEDMQRCQASEERQGCQTESPEAPRKGARHSIVWAQDHAEHCCGLWKGWGGRGWSVGW